MATTTDYAKAVVAIIAMLTLSLLLIICSIPPTCMVGESVLLMLLGIIAATLGLESISLLSVTGDKKDR